MVFSTGCHASGVNDSCCEDLQGLAQLLLVENPALSAKRKSLSCYSSGRTIDQIPGDDLGNGSSQVKQEDRRSTGWFGSAFSCIMMPYELQGELLRTKDMMQTNRFNNVGARFVRACCGHPTQIGDIGVTGRIKRICLTHIFHNIMCF